MRLIPSYIKSEAQRDAYILCFLFQILAWLVFKYERTLIPLELLDFYTLLKLSCIISSLPLFYWLTISPYNQFAIFLSYINLCAYTAIGEYFSPLYFYAFVIGMLSYALLLRPTLKLLTSILAVGGIPTLYIKHLKDIGEITHARQAITIDYVFIALEYMIFIIVIFEGYSKKRRKEIEFRERFSLIGEDLNVFAHNIKSMLSSQFIISENLKESIGDDNQMYELIDQSEKNLNKVYSYLNDFNIIGKSELQRVNVEDSINKVKTLLKIPNEAISIEKRNGVEFEVVVQDFETILINIFSNAMKACSGTDGFIYVLLGDDKVEITNPVSENFKKSSGIGLEVCKKIALRNKLNIVFSPNGERYKALITYR